MEYLALNSPWCASRAGVTGGIRSLHHTVGSRSPGQNFGSLAAPTEALALVHILLVLLSGTKLLSLDIQRGIFFCDCRMLRGWGSTKEKLGGACCNSWLQSPS